MNRPPRPPKEPLFSRQMLALSILQGAGVLVAVVAIFVLARQSGLSDLQTRTLAFTTLIIANLGLILTNRSWTRTIVEMFRSRNVALNWVMGGAVVFLGLVIYVPFLRELFNFATLQVTEALVCLALGFASILWFELFKRLSRQPRSYQG